ncbi:MAG: Fic family protein [Syntrophorhabdus aromaticivorans]|uniref:Fic family protein n=1 Tax=Syntrophorhabdus aromaticivorans TaxID=328301 RepID=A0A971M4N0_9BACT|nr:Fic family protein [Syntrophorhabdus aromaticivorans]
MMTLKRFLAGLDAVPATTSWYLADIGEAKGRQELFTKQSPQRLKSLKEHALIESAISSNRIEGIEVDNKRIGTIIFGNALLHDRSEEEVRCYREALNFIHEKNQQLSISEKALKELHRLARGEIWDAGTYKEKDGDIIEKHPDGTSSVRFKTVAAARTSDYMKELIVLWHNILGERKVHPVIALAAFNLDFLCIHPFRDGNGRVSRLLLLLQFYHQGIEVGRYISLERLIEQNKERYYETLKLSSEGWHEGKYDPWHYINFCCFILKSAYREFEERLDRVTRQKGEKTALVHDAIEGFAGSFSVAEIQQKCPGVGIDMIRRVMKGMQTEGVIECIIRGRDAKWRKVIR